MKFVPHVLIPIVVASIGWTFLACNNSGPNGPGEEGVAYVEITGDFYMAFTGKAYFDVLRNSEDAPESFWIWLFTDETNFNQGRNVWIKRKSAGRPPTGSFMIGSYDDAGTILFVGLYMGTEVRIRSTEGAISINVSTDDRIVGSFAFAGKALVFDDTAEERNVFVEGQFEAVRGSIQSPDQ